MKSHASTTVALLAALSALPLNADVKVPQTKTMMVHGIVQQENLYYAAGAQPVIFTLQPISYDPMKLPPARTVTCWIRAEGRFGFEVPPGQYIVTIKGRKWLSVMQRVKPAEQVRIEASLPGGDVNNDNSVDMLDWNLVNAAINKNPEDVEDYERADANCDGKVDKNDLALVEKNLYHAGE